jgi:hypothetical protein
MICHIDVTMIRYHLSRLLIVCIKTNVYNKGLLMRGC